MKKSKLLTFGFLFLIGLGFNACSNSSDEKIDKKTTITTKFDDGSLWSVYDVIIRNGKDTIRDGVYKRYFKNGGIHIITNFKEGKEDGIYKEYFDDGGLNFSINYKADKISDTLVELFSPLGWKYSDFKYLNGKREGINNIYYQNNKIKQQIVYKNNVIDHVNYTKDSSGRELYKGTLDKGTGFVYNYWGNGTVKEIRVFNNGALMWIVMPQDEKGNYRNAGNLSNGNGKFYKVFSWEETANNPKDTLTYKNGYIE